MLSRRDDEVVMEIAASVVGAALIGIGILLVLVGVFRALGHRWTFGAYDLWLVPVAGILLVLAGRWLIS